MKIALTGASGFIGKRLLKKLVDRFGSDAITAISSEKIDGVHCVLYDKNRNLYFEEKPYIRCDALIHAGAFTPKNKNEANLINQCSSNIYFTENLLQKLDITTLNKVINISTIDVYSEDKNLKESSLVSPDSLYGLSKWYCEKMVYEYAQENKIKAHTLRVGHVYGPGEEVYEKILPVTMKKVIKNEPVEIWGDGTDLRSFIHVDDVVDSVLSALINDIEPEVVNVVSSQPMSINDLVKSIISIENKTIEVKHISTQQGRRDLVFDNSLLMKTLLGEERDFKKFLKDEYEYMLGVL